MTERLSTSSNSELRSSGISPHDEIATVNGRIVSTDTGTLIVKVRNELVRVEVILMTLEIGLDGGNLIVGKPGGVTKRSRTFVEMTGLDISNATIDIKIARGVVEVLFDEMIVTNASDRSSTLIPVGSGGVKESRGTDTIGREGLVPKRAAKRVGGVRIDGMAEQTDLEDRPISHSVLVTASSDSGRLDGGHSCNPVIAEGYFEMDSPDANAVTKSLAVIGTGEDVVVDGLREAVAPADVVCVKQTGAAPKGFGEEFALSAVADAIAFAKSSGSNELFELASAEEPGKRR
jgi:hypothetical protein